MMFSQFRLTLKTNCLKEPKGQMVTGRKWIFYMSALFVHPAGLAFFVSSYKIYSFSPGGSFLMTFDYVYLLELTVIRVQLKMVYKKCLISTSFLSNGTVIIHKYIKDERKKERYVQLTPVCCLVTVSQWSF